MGTKTWKVDPETPQFGARLGLMPDLNHAAVKLAHAIGSTALEADFGRFYVSNVGHWAFPFRQPESGHS